MQDFTKKINIIVRTDIETWRLLNTIAHISAYFGNALGESFDTGDFISTNDGILHPRNSQYPIVILEGDEKSLKKLLQDAKAQTEIKVMPFSRAMTDLNDDGELELFYSGKNEDEIELLGIGLSGDNTLLKIMTKKFSLYK